MDNKKKEELEFYYMSLLSIKPRSIECLDFVNMVILYIYELYNDFDMRYKHIHDISYLTKSEINELCKEILRSIDVKYSMYFCRFLNEKLIRNVSGKKNFSETSVNGMKVRKSNDIEEVITTLHEFGHYMHFMNCNMDLDNQDLFHSTEMIAMTFEFYALFYMQKNGIMTDDVKKTFLSYMEAMYVKCHSVIGEAVGLNIIDKFGDLKVKSIKAYKDMYNVNNHCIDTLNNIKFNDLSYNDEYMYIYGLPMALYMGNRMASSYNYKERFVENFNNIYELGLDKFLKNMSASQILTDPSCLEWVMAYAYSYTMHIIEDDTFNPKMIKFKR